MMITTTSHQTWLFLLLLFINIYSSHSNFAGVCRESERMALLDLKAEFVDDYGRLSSWESTNCCEWKGVVCDNLTNHVVALHLHGPKLVEEFSGLYDEKWLYPAAPLRGKISPSLLQLPHLEYLDLSLNDFDGAQIPIFIGSLSKLQHLSLSHSNFGGQIPHHIGNLSMLHLLDLSGNWLRQDSYFDWLSGFPSLQYLGLNYACLNGGPTALLQVINKLTALTEIHMSGDLCANDFPLSTVSPPSLNSSSSNSLVVLDLSDNNILHSSVFLRFLNMSNRFTHIDFSGNNLEGGIVLDALGNLISLSHLGLRFCNLNEFSHVLGNLTNLSYLDLSGNQLQGVPPKNSSSLKYVDLSSNTFEVQLSHFLTWLWDSTSLQYLSLSDNVISGSFPNMSRFTDLYVLELGDNELKGALLEGNLRLPKLAYLDLSGNKFSGRLPEYIGHLSNIEYLYVSYNLLEGVVTEAHLSSLPKLTSLDLSFNLNISIRISPSWTHPVQFIYLSLAYCKIGPHFPTWLQKQNQLEVLDISNSEIVDTIPSWFWGNIPKCMHLNMSHNQIHGALPNLPSTYKLRTIDLSSNQFTGSLPSFPAALSNIDFSGNKFSGAIPNFASFKYTYLFLDLSNNLLSGEIPSDCFMSLLGLKYVNLANNNFSGEILVGNKSSECSLFSLHLRNNGFRGEIPSSLMNCSALNILDLGHNEFSGKIPGWLGERMPELGVLILKSNLLYGSLPASLCRLSGIQVLDISLNQITETIPKCMDNFSRLSSRVDPASWKDLFSSIRNDSSGNRFRDGVSVFWKGSEETYIQTLGLLKVIDLSSNELFGEIPPQLTTLIGLVGLNLSRNKLVGFIPRDIDQMERLNFLDLSRNNLSGSIPLTLSKLSHLGVLDLSFNNLSGRIPWDTHMQTFEASAYSGNPRLCGPPLLDRPCPEDEKPTNGEGGVDSEDEDKLISRGFYISMLLGFVAAFWIVFWTLFFNKWWNAFSSKICVIVVDYIYVRIVVNKRRLLRYFSGDA